MRATIAAVGLVVMVAAQPAKARFWTGNDLLSACRDATLHAQGTCLGYVMGIADLLVSSGAAICLSERATAGQVKKEVVVAYLTSHPERRDLIASHLVAQALAAAFPCR